MKAILIITFQLIVGILYSQQSIIFKEPLKIMVEEKNISQLKKSEILILTKISYHENRYGIFRTFITAKKNDGDTIELDYKEKNFNFIDVDNIYKVWDACLLKNGTYSNLLKEGYQYKLRNDFNNDALDYINTLKENDLFFNDEFFEDYLYSLINKIHPGILNDERPGNLFVKIIKDPEPNAFSLTNGCIIISTGLLSTIQSEDELVGVLAHEIAHFALDHQLLNITKEKERKKRAEFWSSFATVVAASADAYLSYNNKNYVPGVLTYSTAIAAKTLSDEIVTRLGIKYDQEQERQADWVSQEILTVLKYNKLGLSAALQRIQKYCINTGNYIALSGSGTHPSLDERISQLGQPTNIETFTQPDFLKKVSLINSYNSWIELWYFAHHIAAIELANRNITNGVATESDYIVKAVVKRRTSNTKESNEEVLELFKKAQLLKVTPYIILSKEEGLTYIRLNNKIEAKKCFQTYLTALIELKNSSKAIEEEINWTKKMIFKVDNL